MTPAEALSIAKQYYATGQVAPAEQMCSYALELDPANAGALHALGVIALQGGNATKAVDYLRRATQCEPANAAFWNDLGVASSRAEAFSEAAAACEEAIRLRPDFAEAYSNLGYAHIYQGDFKRAVAVLEEAIRLQPVLADAYGNLGAALKCLDRPKEAAEALEEGIRLNPNNAAAANMAGMVHQRQGNYERAMECYRHSLRVRPESAETLNNLATAYKEQGSFDEAVAYYREALRIQPDYVFAYYNLSEFAAEGKFHFLPEDLERMRGLLASEHVSPLLRSVVAFSLAAVLDAEGSPNEAFRLYEEANELRNGWLRSNNRGFDPQHHRAFVDETIATFDKTYFEHAEKGSADTELPTFIVGMPRSGTTLVEQILSSHPAVFGAGELGEFPRLMAELTGTVGSHHLARPVPFPNRAVAMDIKASYLRRLTQLAMGASRVTLKTPENVFYLGLLATLFPRARVIYCRRDPRDVCLSCYFHNFEFMDYSWSLEDIAFYYRQYERLMDHWSNVLPLPIHEVRYEDLVAHQEDITRRMLTHCGLAWDDRCLTFYNTRRAVQTASTIQVRKPLSTKSIGRWKHYRSHLGPLLAALAKPMLAEIGKHSVRMDRRT